MPEIEHICEDCGQKFKVKQGSRRRFCDDCMTQHIKAGLGKAGRPKKGEKKQ